VVVAVVVVVALMVVVAAAAAANEMKNRRLNKLCYTRLKVPIARIISTTVI